MIGKGDGYSAESALKDSLDPRMIDENMSELQRQTSTGNNTSLMSNMPPIAELPVKQPLNLIKIGMRLGEFHASLLCCSGDQSTPETQETSDSPADNLEEVIEQLRDEQGAINSGSTHDQYFLGNRGILGDEASPFTRLHDRVYRAFGEQVNRDYPLQKFHLPAVVARDDS